MSALHSMITIAYRRKKATWRSLLSISQLPNRDRGPWLRAFPLTLFSPAFVDSFDFLTGIFGC